MPHDVVVRGGEVVDGTGGPGRPADVAIDGGRITAVGVVDGPGTTEIDATGAVVTPGFIDLHTHFDAQIGWDPQLTPSSWHGVTTALMGNCGMTFAPVRPGEGRRLAEMVESVEDISSEAILATLPWTWHTYGDYLDFAEGTHPGLNLAGLVGHCALRYYVMGDRAVDGEPTPDEIDAMARLAGEALDQGAAGLSTSRLPTHVLPDGRPVPGTYAGRAELGALAGAVRDRGGLFQAVLNPAAFDHDLELITEVGAVTGGRVLITAVTVDPNAGGMKQPTPASLAAARAGGADITGTVMPREGGSICGLFAGLPWRTPAWRALGALPHGERLAAIKDPAIRAALVTEAADARPLASSRRVFFMGDDGRARYMAGPESSLAGLAAAAGEAPAETFLRMAEQSDGRAMFSVVRFNGDPELLGELLASDLFLPGLGDAGAHLASIVDASYTTFLLTHWVRDTGRMTLPDAVRRLTSAPADLLGLPDRGRLAPGAAADVNVIDLHTLETLAVEPRYDAPSGAARLVQRATGYRATLVNGEAILLDDRATGRAPGRVLRTSDLSV